jgi:hypothetical protein
MDFPAAPRVGRRVSLGAVVVLAVYLLLAPPLFLLAPFVLLTLFSRPRTLRELFWLIAAGTGAGLTLQGPHPLGVEIMWASGLVLAAVFLVLSLRSEAPVFGRALLAVLVTTVAIGAWEWTRGISWEAVQQAFTTMLREGYQAMLSPTGAGSAPKTDLQNFIQPFIDAAPDLARAMPGVLMLEGLAGVLLAWGWHHRVAVHPLGQAPAPLRRFRFNDQFIWGAIFTLAVLVLPLPAEAKAVAENLLVVWIGLYAMRGLAIAVSILSPGPLGFKVLVSGMAILLIPLTLGVCLALGLADTWLDIRGRLTPPAPGGSSR